MSQIPPEFKCSRCKLDMRCRVEHGGCTCDRSTKKATGSKSGNAVIVTEFEYQGYDYANLPRKH